MPLRERIARGLTASDPFGTQTQALDEALDDDDEEPSCAVCGVTERELAANDTDLVVVEQADGELLCEECAADLATRSASPA